jgi:hypothetical protein
MTRAIGGKNKTGGSTAASTRHAVLVSTIAPTGIEPGSGSKSRRDRPHIISRGRGRVLSGVPPYEHRPLCFAILGPSARDNPPVQASLPECRCAICRRRAQPSANQCFPRFHATTPRPGTRSRTLDDLFEPPFEPRWSFLKMPLVAAVGRRFDYKRERRVRRGGTVIMATEPDYCIMTFETGDILGRWDWELRRRSSPWE